MKKKKVCWFSEISFSELESGDLCEKQLPPNPGVAPQFGPSFTEPTLFRGGRLRFSFFVLTFPSWPEVGVDVTGLPVKELVAILSGNAPSLHGWGNPQLAE